MRSLTKNGNLAKCGSEDNRAPFLWRSEVRQHDSNWKEREDNGVDRTSSIRFFQYSLVVVEEESIRK